MVRRVLFLLILSHAFPLGHSSVWAMGKTPPRETPPESAPAPKLTLSDCFELALRRSETVAISHEEIEKAKASFFTATSEALGDVSFVMNHNRLERQRGGSESGVGGTLTASSRRDREFTISQPIFQGFRSLGALTGAGSLKGRRVNEKARQIELLFIDVADSFYHLLTQKKDVKTILEIQSLYSDRIADLEEREEIGRSRPSEVATARSRMQTLEADLAQSHGALSNARYLLEFLTGDPLADDQLIDEEVPMEQDVDLDLMLAGIDDRTDVQAALDAMHTYKRAIIVAQSGLWPTIDYQSNHYERRDGFQSGIDWDMLIKVEIPLFRGGENIGKIKEAVSNYKQAKLTYELTRRQAELEIKESYENWLTSLKRHQSLQKAEKSAEENFRLQTDEYKHNLVNNLDVLEALQTLLETRQDANRVYYEMKGNYWRMEVARGNCCGSASPGIADQNQPAESSIVQGPLL